MIVLGINDGHDAGESRTHDGYEPHAPYERRQRNANDDGGGPPESIPAAIDRAGPEVR